MSCEVRCRRRQRRVGLSRKEQQLLRSAWGRGLHSLRPLQDDMSIGAADTEGTHPGTAWSSAGGPFGRPGVDEERTVSKIDFWIRLFKMQIGWNELMVQREGRID